MADPGRHELTPGRARRATPIAALITVLTVAAMTLVTVAIQRPNFRPGLVGSPLAENAISTAGRTVAMSRVPVNSASAHAYSQERLIAAIMEDLTTFWIDTLDAETGRSFTALKGGLTAIDSAARTGSAPCVGSPGHIVGNAFYCPPSDGIIYDSSALIPVLLHRYSIGGLVSTFAHEFGHAVQAQMRAGSPASSAPDSLLTEAQADCDAGAFLAWAVQGRADHIRMGPDLLMAAIGPIIDFADPATVDPKDPTAHGLAVDRLGWFLLGYSDGAASCLTMTESSMDNLLGAVPAPDDADTRFTSRQAALTAAAHSIAGFNPAAPPGTADPALLDAVAPFGQFAEAAALAVDIGTQIYRDRRGAACFTGAWVASVYGSQQLLGSWPGDVDEALEVIRRLPGATIEELAAYLDGFHEGQAGCR